MNTRAGTRSTLTRRRHVRVLAATILVGLLGGTLVQASPAAADPTVPVTVTIPRVVAIQNPDPGPFQFEADMYARVTIDGFPAEQSAEVSDRNDASPFWVFTRDVDASSSPIPIQIQVFDADTFLAAPDDVIDLNPVDNRTDLILFLDMTTGNWTFGGDPIPANATSSTGDGDKEHTGTFEGGEQGQIFFDVSLASTTGDADGDGLLDGWETRGFDADGDGTVDVDLPEFGADPRHKDLFLELDYESGEAPRRSSIQAMKAAFRAAPLDNPDGTTGVNLWVDTGRLVDTSGRAREGQAPNTCNDGIDNGTDNLIDGADRDCKYLDASVEDPGIENCEDLADNDNDNLEDGDDPDCRVGDNLGGGSRVAAIGACKLDTAFYRHKATNFNADQRKWIFRYGVSADIGTGCESSGGWGELGGNDFVDFNHDGGTIMHELGHTLGLRHGGNEDNNCKPNYVSIMNYDQASGVSRVGGGTILDFSPPRIALNGSTRGEAPLPNLVENNLDDGAVLDASDTRNRYMFVDPNGSLVQYRLDTGANWNSDTDPPDELDQSINIDTSDSDNLPKACKNNSSNDTLEGFHDWSAVSIPFRQFGDSASGPINPVTTAEPTTEELEEVEDALNTADLAVSVSDSPDPVAAGTQLTYTATVTNNGPNPASSVELVDTLPAEVSFSEASAGCTHAAGVVTCGIGELESGETTSVTITVEVPAGLVHDNGGPKTISDSMTVRNLAGPDPDSTNDSATESTEVVAVADLVVESVTTTSPLEVLIGAPASASVDVTVRNDGPSSPMDTVLTGTASASAGASVTPTGTSTDVDGLTATPQTVSRQFTLSCTAPGVQTVSFEYTIAPGNAADTDPDLTANVRQASFQVDCVVPIAVNVRPGWYPNSINLNTDATLAALTTRAGEYGLPVAFDAATIRVGTVRWGLRSNLFDVATPTGATEIHGKLHKGDAYELDERTRDGDVDAMFHFKPAASGLAPGVTEACLKGTYVSGGRPYRFLGCDSVAIRPPG